MTKGNKRCEFRYFTIFDWEAEQDYLRARHKEGWKFVRVSGLGLYHFERCAPEDVVYHLDYNPDGIAHKAEYIQMFQDCGWEYLQDYVGYSYFRKPSAAMQGKEEIFCDDESRMDMMKRVLKNRGIPLIALLLCVVLLRCFGGHGEAEGVISVMFTGVLVLYLVVFALLGWQYWRYWKSLHK